MNWQAPVFDRSQEDVDTRAKKAYINVDDINRIEGNSEVLAALVGAVITTQTTWRMQDFLTLATHTRIANNLSVMLSAWHKLDSWPAVPPPPLNTWQKLNAIEQLHYELHRLRTENSARFFYAGEAFAGQEIGVI